MNMIHEMLKISVIIITLNEERNIARCIESIQDISDDIIVVDSFSWDKTKEICKKYQIRFIEHKFESYIQQKNWAITQAKHQFILSIDADEALSDKLKDSIKTVIENWTHDGYCFNRLSNYCGKWIKHCAWYPDKKLRLWDSKKGRWTSAHPHARLELEKGSTVKHIKGDLLHYSYDNTTEYIDKVNSDTEIAAIEAFQNGKRSNLLKIIILTCWNFFKDYFLKLGILDGYYGFLICNVLAYTTFIKYVKLKELNKKQISINDNPETNNLKQD